MVDPSCCNSTPNPWLSASTHSALVPLPPPYSHRLYVKILGPKRCSPLQSVLVFFSGGGAPTLLYMKLMERLTKRWRVLVYDRAGYGKSEMPWEIGSGNDQRRVIMAQDSAQELRALLSAISLPGPYVVIAHSYGGIVAREFIELMNHSDAIIGLSLIEPASELLYQIHKPSIPPPSFTPLLENVDISSLLHLRSRSGFTDLEWDAVIAAIATTAPNTEYEDCRASGRRLAERKQIERRVMDPWPVGLLRGDWYRQWKVLFDKGVEVGNGSEEEREECRRFLWEVDVF
ncbi:Alpha/Beta hydrolase protein, partial [Clohesyomyces aquaticus]